MSIWTLLLIFYVVGAAVIAVSEVAIMRGVNKRNPEGHFPWHGRRVVVTTSGALLWPFLALIGIVFLAVMSFPSGRLWLFTRGWMPDLSSVEGDGGLDTLAPSPRWWSYTATRLAHYQPGLMLLFVVVDVISNHASHYKGTLALVAILCLALLLASIFAEWHHQRRLCARCAAATPADGQRAAEQRRPWLRFQHWHSRHPWLGILLWALGIVIGVIFHITSAAASYPLYLYWMATAMANLRHRPVQPWCPQCKGWGWGDEDRSPIPVPTGQGHK